MSEEFLTVSQYAALIGVSEKTARKRITRGDVKAERAALPGGGWSWRVYPERLEAVGNRLEVQSESESAQAHERLESAPVAVGSAPTTKAPTVPTDATARELLAQSREEILFLRGLVEQRDRDAAELRAALREALKAMPKAITAGNESAAIEAAQGAQSTQANQTGASAKQSPQNSTQRKIRPWQKVIMRMINVKL
jgi:Fic family protein